MNRSWREQAKVVTATSVDGVVICRFASVWQAAQWVMLEHECKHETAKKEIRRAIKTGGVRYGYKWEFAND